MSLMSCGKNSSRTHFGAVLLCIHYSVSVLPLPVGTDHHSAKKILILTMKLWIMKKSSDFDHEKMNLVEKNLGTPAILGRTLLCAHRAKLHLPVPDYL
jgi:hypothetical protein